MRAPDEPRTLRSCLAILAAVLLLLLCDAAAAQSWSFIAWENQTFTVSGTQTVRFGVDNRWIVKTVSGTVPCTNAYFGTDPAVGIGKACELLTDGSTSPPPSDWVRIALENQSFTVSGTQTVRFGSDTRWIQKSVTDAGQCTNAFFGSDPAVGIGKV